MTNDPDAPAPISSTPARTPTDPRWRITPAKWAAAGLLLIAIVVPLLVSTYDSVEPRLFGFPFFYWYQLLWVFLAAGFCGLSYLLLARERRSYRPPAARTSDGPRGGRGGSSSLTDNGGERR